MDSRPESGKFAAILLAAGSSSRLGQPKQMVEIDGESLVRRASRLLLNLNPVSVTVVTGYHSEDVMQELLDLPLRVVKNDDWEQGQGGSIARGTFDISEEPDGVLITMCDLWKIKKTDLTTLIKAWSSDISRINVSSWFEGESIIYGPPALFPRKYIRELKQLRGNHGARSIIAQNRSEVRFVEMENAAFDLDTPADLEQLLKSTGPNPSS
ncbi:NTP transferase domain-containing protein [Pseudomonadota bacterium]